VILATNLAVQHGLMWSRQPCHCAAWSELVVAALSSYLLAGGDALEPVGRRAMIVAATLLSGRLGHDAARLDTERRQPQSVQSAQFQALDRRSAGPGLSRARASRTSWLASSGDR
jgi:hypothetical protein